VSPTPKSPAALWSYQLQQWPTSTKKRRLPRKRTPCVSERTVSWLQAEPATEAPKTLLLQRAGSSIALAFPSQADVFSGLSYTPVLDRRQPGPVAVIQQGTRWAVCHCHTCNTEVCTHSAVRTWLTVGVTQTVLLSCGLLLHRYGREQQVAACHLVTTATGWRAPYNPAGAAAAAAKALAWATAGLPADAEYSPLPFSALAGCGFDAGPFGYMAP
jgi:hypothetical protein